MKLEECYKILELEYGVSNDEVKKAYRKLAMIYHPDKNSSEDSSEKFKKISEAYHYILNPNESESNINNLFNNIFEEFTNEFNNNYEEVTGINNLFRNIFKENTKCNKGKDNFKLVDITLEDIYNGKNIIISYDTHIINNNYKICSECNGKGKIQTIEQIGPLQLKSLNNCFNCKGYGYIDLYLNYNKTIEINIPKGYNYNNKIIYEKQGSQILNGINGDLIISFNFIKHQFFKLKDNDLYISIDITLKESLLGFIKSITHLDNRILNISSENIIKPNMIKCIENEGIYDNETNKYGNLYIKFKINFPKILSEEQYNAIDKLF